MKSADAKDRRPSAPKATFRHFTWRHSLGKAAARRRSKVDPETLVLRGDYHKFLAMLYTRDVARLAAPTT